MCYVGYKFSDTKPLNLRLRGDPFSEGERPGIERIVILPLFYWNSSFVPLYEFHGTGHGLCIIH